MSASTSTSTSNPPPPEESSPTAITPDQFRDDTNVCARRAAGVPAHREGDFTWLEKISFNDLLQEWCNARPESQGHTQVMSMELRKSFFNRVFKYWSSDEDLVSFPTLPAKKREDTSRKRGQDKQTNKNRLANGQAWLSVRFDADENEIKFVWRDFHGSEASSKFVQLNPGLTKAAAMEKAIVNWDTRERERVETYNTALIVALARMRILRFVAAGTALPPYIPHELQVNERLLKCSLISDKFEEHYTVYNLIHQGLAGRRIGNPSHDM
ncbi:hypothetical protein Forpi1262_v002658 [Fusarium oxysporum f. sp. raphani]|uniref:Uncharacterized protein n=1 Tax=Fusarium oxysporum f. sp. raphani TaxID=96318 RepID=A0A8J5UBB9_FUSOX|nr:hypothetical protein Forpi1262_v002658 [Fusarium oxysporum f. sp. raphani]